MKDKKQYYVLDEIGFVGTQKKGNSITLKKDISDTVQFIKSKKANNISLKSKKRSASKLLK
jgi:hypothetical protein